MLKTYLPYNRATGSLSKGMKGTAKNLILSTIRFYANHFSNQLNASVCMAMSNLCPPS